MPFSSYLKKIAIVVSVILGLYWASATVFIFRNKYDGPRLLGFCLHSHGAMRLRWHMQRV